ncbi:hypothetical protein LEMLEM_LOCUS4912 [Lemmus lemmus]
MKKRKHVFNMLWLKSASGVHCALTAQQSCASDSAQTQLSGTAHIPTSRPPLQPERQTYSVPQTMLRHLET